MTRKKFNKLVADLGLPMFGIYRYFSVSLHSQEVYIEFSALCARAKKEGLLKYWTSRKNTIIDIEFLK